MESAKQPIHYRDLLIRELRNRKDRNQNYSLRAFANDLGINRTSLSAVMRGKRGLSVQGAQRIADKLHLSPVARSRLIQVTRGEAARTQSKKLQEQLFLDEDQFYLISDWHYFAIINLARIPKTPADPEALGARLGLLKSDVERSLERLTRMGLIEIRKGYLVRTAQDIETSEDLPSSALRSHHRQTLQKAMDSIEQVDMELRELSSITLPFALDDLIEAKTMIRRFKRRFLNQFPQNRASEVYSLAIQFFPLTKNKGRITK